jgi:hypothetical protein
MSATTHRIDAVRSGTFAGMDFDNEYVITYRFATGLPAEIEFVSITPGAGGNAPFPDLAQRDLEMWAADWLSDHYDEAVAVALADRAEARERAIEYRREM